MSLLSFPVSLPCFTSLSSFGALCIVLLSVAIEATEIPRLFPYEASSAISAGCGLPLSEQQVFTGVTLLLGPL